MFNNNTFTKLKSIRMLIKIIIEHIKIDFY